MPSNSFSDHILIDAIPIAADGAFKATVSEQGTVDGHHAQYTRIFQGHFHGFDSSGAARFAGQIRDTVTYSDGGAVSCRGSAAYLMTKD